MHKSARVRVDVTTEKEKWNASLLEHIQKQLTEMHLFLNPRLVLSRENAYLGKILNV